MKKLILALAALLLAVMLGACGETTVTTGTTTAAEDTAAEKAEETTAAAESGDVDIDLTKMSGTMVYSEVLNMQQRPNDYMGKIIKMKGPFSVTKTEENTYFACIISDATACCATGIEFELKGDYSYPKDYPKPQTEITVTGTFTTYMEGKNKYLQLKDAEISY